MNDLNKDFLGLPEKDSFDVWLGDRPKWLQTAAHRLIETKRLPNVAEIAELANLCQLEAIGAGDEKFTQVQPGSLALASVRPKVRINNIKNVQGVAALRQDAILDFGAHNLTVVYGTNGAGKSGFTRLLKHICGASRKDEKLHSNIFEEGAPSSCASLQVLIADAEQEFNWKLENGPVSALRMVHVFDSQTASMYLANKTEASYEPTQMRFISSLIKVCDAVADLINAKKSELVKKMPLMPTALVQTTSAVWLGKLSATITQDTVDKTCLFSEAQASERLTLETALAQKDVAGRLSQIAKERTALSQCKAYLSGVKNKLSDAVIGAIVEQRAQAFAKRKAADEDVKRAFSDSILDGIGNDSWKALWTQAKIFSTSYAYPDKEFPNPDDDAKCILCNQDLNKQAQDRLKHFEQFVQGGLEASAKDAERELATKVSSLPSIPSNDEWILQLAVLKLSPETCGALRDAIVKRKHLAESAVTKDDFSDLDWAIVESPLEQLLLELNVEEKALRDLQEDEKRKLITARVSELRAKEWLSQNKQAVVDEVQRLADVAKLERSLSYASTVNLTRKSNELAKSELSAAYQLRFANELRELGGSQLRVIAQSKQEGKGKTTFTIALRDAKHKVAAEQILSEGEFRIVALAAFLADITGANQSTPFIFDDPISSLDQDYEERVVRRLVNLAKTRQVIIFTHRLSLLAQVENEIKKIKDLAKTAGEPPAVQLHVETLRRMGSVSGVRVAFSVRDSKPDKAINYFKNECLPKLKKMIENLDEQYEQYAKGVCSDFRILVEKCVESTLLNDVITRFRRPINTMGKLSELAKIKNSDCHLIDDLMTRYSVFEHSQSDELPAPVPDVRQIEEDIQTLASWLTEFSKRPVPAD